MKKYYDVLGLPPDASFAEVKEAYRDLTKVWHPDRFPSGSRVEKKANRKLKEINEAYRKIQNSRSDKSRQKRDDYSSRETQHSSQDASQRRQRRSRNSDNTSRNRRRKKRGKASSEDGISSIVKFLPSSGTITAVIVVFLLFVSFSSFFLSSSNENTSDSAGTSTSIANSEKDSQPPAAGKMPDLAGRWIGELNRADESWSVNVVFSQSGATLNGASRKKKGGASVLWEVKGKASSYGLLLQEEQVLHDHRLPGMVGKWCARSGRLQIEEGTSGRKLTGRMTAKQGTCPDATLNLSYAGEESSPPVEAVFTEPEQPLPTSGTVVSQSNARDIAPLRIVTRGRAHYLVKLSDWNTGEDFMSIFVRGGDTVEREVPLGTYRIQYASGQTWYGKEYLFGPSTMYSQADESFSFRIIGNRVNGYTLELYKRIGGNLHTRKIPRSQW